MEPSPAEEVLTVSELTRRIRRSLEDEFPHVCVVGEVSNLARPKSGHVYLTLKDGGAQVSAVLWRSAAVRLRFDLEDGMEVIVTGSLSVYEPRGSYQITISSIKPKGLGALQLAFLRLKDKLEKEGLFRPEHKRPLPYLPECVGVVTSPTGAAIHDILTVIARRFPPAHVVLRPVRVQGEGAAAEIAQAIEDFNTWGGADVLIVGRGGGSLEDLWAFNEEIVARAIYASRIPIISAVGHEIDVTISDLVADRRALTPTEAAEIVLPEFRELVGRLDDARGRLAAALRGQVGLARARLEQVRGAYGFRVPSEMVRRHEQRLDDLCAAAALATRRRLEAARDRLAAAAGRLEALSPLGVLRRGYSITRIAGTRTVLRDAAQVHKGQSIETLLHAGRLVSQVQEAESHDAGGGEAPRR
ncbi:MAG TPA: exodeoxyribonuclease VII large subunit [Planctomycetota bacterium]|nr:exodeoxyribonuclease VII large subunit [Planctomycetota bacterium]HRR83349.1 exodeoxyribonuclease VII large subunit [Planctomycetota bacterium]HRT97897.1 exodeoxyribonuclease VII large subunit [Planctomycetota bacterium]